MTDEEYAYAFAVLIEKNHKADQKQDKKNENSRE